MKIPLVKYKENEPMTNSWVRHLIRRIDLNKNNLITVVGQTGSGKTWSAISICEMMSNRNGIYFGIENIVFTLKSMMNLLNSGTLKKGSCLIFDEPQVTISSREFMSKANKVFNYVVSTFRHLNLTLFFCTPYEDLLDKSTRKMFHAKFETVSIDRNSKTVKLKPKIMVYNSQKGKFYEAWLRRHYKMVGRNVYTIDSIKRWKVPKPSDDIIKLYEAKKKEFTTNLNKEIEADLTTFEKVNQPKSKIDQLLPHLKVAFELWKKGIPAKIAYTSNEFNNGNGLKNVQTYHTYIRDLKIALGMPISRRGNNKG